MARKGSAAVEELREILSVAPGTDETAHERAYHVSALRQANSSAYGPWATAQSARRSLRRLERALVARRRCRRRSAWSS
jgi:hypothetical protein